METVGIVLGLIALLVLFKYIIYYFFIKKYLLLFILYSLFIKIIYDKYQQDVI